MGSAVVPSVEANVLSDEGEESHPRRMLAWPVVVWISSQHATGESGVLVVGAEEEEEVEGALLVLAAALVLSADSPPLALPRLHLQHPLGLLPGRSPGRVVEYDGWCAPRLV